MDSYRIISDNLAALDIKQSSLCERRAAHIAERARLLMAESDGDQELPVKLESIRAAYRELIPGGGRSRTCADGAIPENRRAVSELYASVTAHDRICLCRCLSDLYGRSACPEDFFSQESVPPNGRIAYLRSAYADAAYRSFAAVLPDPTVTYCDDFNGVCEDVYYGRSGSCILPIENSSEGRFATFRTLIGKYELKIVLTCPVTSADSGVVTRFALCRKNIERVRLGVGITGSPMFELTLTLPAADGIGSPLGDILTAAACFGLTLCRLDSVPISYTDTEYAYDIIFHTEDARLDCFLWYLALEAPQFTAVGIYSHLQ